MLLCNFVWTCLRSAIVQSWQVCQASRSSCSWPSPGFSGCSRHWEATQNTLFSLGSLRQCSLPPRMLPSSFDRVMWRGSTSTLALEPVFLRIPLTHSSFPWLTLLWKRQNAELSLELEKPCVLVLALPSCNGGNLLNRLTVSFSFSLFSEQKYFPLPSKINEVICLNYFVLPGR